MGEVRQGTCHRAQAASLQLGSFPPITPLPLFSNPHCSISAKTTYLILRVRVENCKRSWQKRDTVFAWSSTTIRSPMSSGSKMHFVTMEFPQRSSTYTSSSLTSTWPQITSSEPDRQLIPRDYIQLECQKSPTFAFNHLYLLMVAQNSPTHHIGLEIIPHTCLNL
ncbi:hypothetical protein BDV06DRAFT_133986 [Aspergillus oleicola]